MISRRAMKLRVLSGGDHRSQPVQGGVGVVAADALDEGADRVEVAVSGAVVGKRALLGGGFHVCQARRDAPVRVAEPLRSRPSRRRLRGR